MLMFRGKGLVDPSAGQITKADEAEMKRLLFAVAFFSSAMLLRSAAEAQSASPGDVAKNCEGCHGPGGNNGQSMTPRLNGQTREYLVNRLQEFRNPGTQTPHAIDAMWERMATRGEDMREALAA